MRLTALCVCGTLLAFLTLSWTTADSDEGDILGDHGFGPCAATLRPEGPCRQEQDENMCPYQFSLPPLTLHLPNQLRELEQIVKDLQKLKDNVDQLRKMCADCTVSQTERECGRQSEGEHGKLNESTDIHKEDRNWLNERNLERPTECGTDRVTAEKTMEGDGDTDSEKRAILEEKGRKKWEAERVSDKGVVKENEREVKEAAEKDGKTKTEGAKGKDKPGQAKVPTAGENEKKVDVVRKVTEKNNRETDINQDKDGKQDSKGDQEDQSENGKKRKITSNVKNKEKTEESDHHVWRDETEETEKRTQTEADRRSDGIKMSEDHDEHTNKEREEHGEERKKEMEKRIKVEQNNEKPKQAESIGRAEKERTIKKGEVEDGETGTEIKTDGEKTVQSVQRDSDGELASSKATERTDFVSISPTPHPIISLAPRQDSMDPNQAVTFTSFLPSPPLSSSASYLITDANQRMITVVDRLTIQSSGPGADGIFEHSTPDAEEGLKTTSRSTTTASINTLGGPRQQITRPTSRFTSTTSARPGAGFQGRVSLTTASTTTTTHRQNLFTTTFPGAADRSRWTAKKNISSNTKTGVKPPPGRGLKPGEKQKPAIKPEADQKHKNPRIDRKPDRPSLSDKKTKYDQKQKPSHQKPTTEQKSKPAKSPPRFQIPKPDQRPPPDHLPPKHQIPKPDQRPPPDHLPPDHQIPKIDQRPPPDHLPTDHRIPKPDQRPPPDHLPTDHQIPKPDRRPPPDHLAPDHQIPKTDQRPPPDHLPTDHRIPKPDQRPPPDHLPPDHKIPKPDQRPPPDHLPPDHQIPKIDQRPPPDHLPTDHRIPKPDQRPPPDHLPTDHRIPKPDQRPPPDHLPTDHQIPKPDRRPPPDHLPPDHQIPKTDQRPPPDHLPTDHRIPKPDQRPPPDHLPPDHKIPKPDQRPPPDHLPPDHQIPKIDQRPPPDNLQTDHRIPKPDQRPPPDHLPTDHQIPKTDRKPTPDHLLTDHRIPKPDGRPPTDYLPTDHRIPKPDQRPPPDHLPVDHRIPKPDGRPPTDYLPTDHRFPIPNRRPTADHLPTDHKITTHVESPPSDHLLTDHQIPNPDQRPPPDYKIPKPGQRPPPDHLPTDHRIPKPDQRPPPDNLPTDHQIPNPDQRPPPDHKIPKPDQTPPPVHLPTDHQIPKPDQKPQPDNLPTDHHIQIPDRRPPHDHQIPKPGQKPPPDHLPTDQNLKNNQLSKHDQEHTTDQSQLLTRKPQSHQKSIRPVYRPTSYQRPQTVNSSGFDKDTDQELESTEIPIIAENSKPVKKQDHPLKTDKPDQMQKLHTEAKSEEKTKSDQWSTINPYVTPDQEPKINVTTSFTPKSDQKPITEFMENSDENPKSVLTPGQKLTPDHTLIKPPHQKPKTSQKIPKINQKPTRKHPELVPGQKTKPNLKPRHPETNQGLNLNPKSVPAQIPEAESNKTPELKPPHRRRPPTRPSLRPGATPVQRPKPAVQLKPSPKTKTDLDLLQIRRTNSDDIQNSQTDMPPAPGPATQTGDVIGSPGVTEFSTTTMKTITAGPKTSNSLETEPFPHLHIPSEGVTMSPNSRITSDLKPHTTSRPPSIPMTTIQNKIVRGIPPGVIPSTSPVSTKPHPASNTDSSLQAKILHNVEETAPTQTPNPDKMMIPVLTPGARTTSTISPDLRSTTSGPEPLAAESSTPSARELRVKINQVAAFLNNSLTPNGRPPDRRPKEHPEDNQRGSRPDKQLPTLKPSKVTMPRDCSDHLLRGERRSRVYLVTPDLRSRSFPVLCDMELNGGGWTLLQRRQDGSVSFNRTWAEYRAGFGQLDGGEFWLGNNMIHLLTRDRDMVLRVELEDFDGVMEYAEYEHFRVASERMRYRLSVGGYSGTAGDALRFSKSYDHNNRAFTTPDRDHDRYPSGNCGAYYSSGWWFDACMAANLNGRYYEGRYKGVRDGIFWGTWHNISAEYYPTNDRQSFKMVRMMIRPKGFAP